MAARFAVFLVGSLLFAPRHADAQWSGKVVLREGVEVTEAQKQRLRAAMDFLYGRRPDLPVVDVHVSASTADLDFGQMWEFSSTRRRITVPVVALEDKRYEGVGIRFMLAHELGHIVEKPNGVPFERELSADGFAMELVDDDPGQRLDDDLFEKRKDIAAYLRNLGYHLYSAIDEQGSVWFDPEQRASVCVIAIELQFRASLMAETAVRFRSWGAPRETNQFLDEEYEQRRLFLKNTGFCEQLLKELVSETNGGASESSADRLQYIRGVLERNIAEGPLRVNDGSVPDPRSEWRDHAMWATALGAGMWVPIQSQTVRVGAKVTLVLSFPPIIMMQDKGGQFGRLRTIGALMASYGRADIIARKTQQNSDAPALESFSFGLHVLGHSPLTKTGWFYGFNASFGAVTDSHLTQPSAGRFWGAFAEFGGLGGYAVTKRLRFSLGASGGIVLDGLVSARRWDISALVGVTAFMW
jgi:hypothetical protein